MVSSRTAPRRRRRRSTRSPLHQQQQQQRRRRRPDHRRCNRLSFSSRSGEQQEQNQEQKQEQQQRRTLKEKEKMRILLRRHHHHHRTRRPLRCSPLLGPPGSPCRSTPRARPSGARPPRRRLRRAWSAGRRRPAGPPGSRQSCPKTFRVFGCLFKNQKVRIFTFSSLKQSSIGTLLCPSFPFFSRRASNARSASFFESTAKGCRAVEPPPWRVSTSSSRAAPRASASRLPNPSSSATPT